MPRSIGILWVSENLAKQELNCCIVARYWLTDVNSSSSDRMALEDVDIVIEAGEKFGLCGRSGRSVHQSQDLRPPYCSSLLTLNTITAASLPSWRLYSGCWMFGEAES